MIARSVVFGTPHVGMGKFSAVLALAVLGAFSSVIRGETMFCFRDFAGFGLPIADYLHSCIWSGDFPFWNPFNHCGVPFLAQWNTQVLYPPAYFYVIFPVSWALPLFNLLHLYLGGVGMYGLVRFYSASSLAGGIAGFAYAFNGLTLNCLDWPNNIAALGWMPWVVLTAELSIRHGRRRWAVFCGTLQMLTGAPEMILFTWFSCIMLVLSTCLSKNKWRHITLSLAGTFAIVIMLSAVQLLPFLDLLLHSQRDRNFGTDAWSMPLTGWMNFVVPLFQTSRAYYGVFVQHGQYWTTSYYVGGAIFVLAIWTAVMVRDRLVYGSVILLLFSMITALGNSGYLLAWLAALFPQIGMMRYPIKFVTIAMFVIPILAGIGISKFENGTAGKQAVSLCLVALFVISLAGIGVYWGSDNLSLGDDWVTIRSNALTRLTLTNVIIGCIILNASVSVANSPMLRAILLLMVFFDLIEHAPRHPDMPRAVYSKTPQRKQPVPTIGVFRAYLTADSNYRLNHMTTGKMVSDFEVRRGMLHSNFNLFERIPTLGGLWSLRLRDEVLFQQLLLRRKSMSSNILDFLGVAQISSSSNLLQWDIRSAPRTMVSAGLTPVWRDDIKAGGAQHLEDFNPRTEVVLDNSQKALVGNLEMANVTVTGTIISPHRIEFDVVSDGPTVAIIAQTYYRNWIPEVNGRRVPLLRANYAFQAVPIPVGQSKVLLRYRDWAFVCGSIISGLGVISCGYVAIVSSCRIQSFKRQAQNEETDSPSGVYSER